MHDGHSKAFTYTVLRFLRRYRRRHQESRAHGTRLKAQSYCTIKMINQRHQSSQKAPCSIGARDLLYLGYARQGTTTPPKKSYKARKHWSVSSSRGWSHEYGSLDGRITINVQPAFGDVHRLAFGKFHGFSLILALPENGCSFLNPPSTMGVRVKKEILAQTGRKTIEDPCCAVRV